MRLELVSNTMHRGLGRFNPPPSPDSGNHFRRNRRLIEFNRFSKFHEFVGTKMLSTSIMESYRDQMWER